MNVRIASATTIRSGVITSRIETALARRAAARASRPGCRTSRWTSAITRSSGSERSRNVRASGRAAASSALLAPEHLVQPPARGVREREQPQRLAGRRAVDDDHVPVARLDVALELQQAEQLVAAGRDGQLLGRDPVDAALDSSAAEPALHRATSGARARPAPAPAAPTGRRRPRSARRRPAPRSDVGERVRRVGREHERARAGGGAAARRGGGDRRLADAALARVEDGPRGQAPEPTVAACAWASAPSRRPARRPGLPARSRRVSCTV